MPRFFVDAECIDEGKIIIRDKDAFHIARSLRMAVGDSVDVSDGSGMEYLCRLESIHDEECVASIVEARRSERELPVSVTLFMAMPKGDKLELVVQKAVELGASRIVPFESERCIRKIAGEKAGKLADRLSRIAYEAAKQCGRARVPEVSGVVSFSDMCGMLGEYDLSLFCYEGSGTESVRKVLEGADSVSCVCAIVGSEGGFSPVEAERIREAGARCVGLGPRILRCETAPMYVLSAISYRFEL